MPKYPLAFLIILVQLHYIILTWPRDDAAMNWLFRTPYTYISLFSKTSFTSFTTFLFRPLW